MKGTVFFEIEGKELIVEQVLVEYNEAPIFFVCKDENSYYIASCIDLEKERYFVASVELSGLAKMLHGQVSMRKFLLQSEEYWDIVVGEDVSQDIVIKKKIAEVCLEDLPYENTYFTIATKEIERYVEAIDAKIYTEGDWKSDFCIGWNEYSEKIMIETLHEYKVSILEEYQSALGKITPKTYDAAQEYEKEVAKEELWFGVKEVRLRVDIKNENNLSIAA